MAQIDVISFEQIATMLSQLATNYSNLFADYYNLFYNPTPMDVTVELYDDSGNLETITIPNRAKDRTYILNGSGVPEGNVSAVKGSIYQDVTDGTAYIKQFANTDNTGWSELMTLELLENYLIQGSGSPEGVVTAPKGVLFIDRAAANLYVKATATGNTGWALISANTATLADVNLSNLSEVGENHFANLSLSNLNAAGSALITGKESVNNKVTTISSTSTDTQYPSAKATYDFGEAEILKCVNIENQVRDCILESPNGLPSVINNTILLPSGTVLLCTNGINNSNQRVNEKVTTSSILSVFVDETGNKNGVVFYDSTNNRIIYYLIDEYYRQTSQPSSYTKMIWYNPSSNEYKVTSNSGSSWSTISATEIGRFNIVGGNVTGFSPFHPLVVATQEDIASINANISQRNIGEIVQSTIPLSDAGLHLLDGSLITYGSYSAFVDYIADLYDSGDYTAIFDTEANWQSAVTTYGVCGKFVYNSTNKTVRLPKYSNKIYTSNITSTVPVKGNGTTLGLTDGTNNYGAQVGSVQSGYISPRLSAYGTSAGSAYASGDGTNATIGITTDGSKSGIIADLANITTSLDGYYYIVIATTTKTAIQVDIDEIATDLNGKADTDLSNTNDTAKILMSGMGMPSETYVNLTLGASETEYVAPANGWVQITQAFTTACYILIATVYANKDGACMMNNSSTSAVLNAYIPVSKGETFKVSYNGTLNTSASENRFEFIYAVGSESEAS